MTSILRIHPRMKCFQIIRLNRRIRNLKPLLIQTEMIQIFPEFKMIMSLICKLIITFSFNKHKTGTKKIFNSA